MNEQSSEFRSFTASDEQLRGTSIVDVGSLEQAKAGMNSYYSQKY
jgi:hypothetical protein